MIQRTRDLEAQSIAAGYVKSRTCLGNETQVTMQFWLGIDADAKRGFAQSMAALCEDEKSGNRMTIVDSQSGRKLATFSYGSFEVF